MSQQISQLLCIVSASRNSGRTFYDGMFLSSRASFSIRIPEV